MKLEPATKAKLEHGKATLAAELATVPRAVISNSVDATAARLLRSARFDDYIPLLAQKYVRNGFRRRSAA
jgi:hypothetical protein